MPNCGSFAAFTSPNVGNLGKNVAGAAPSAPRSGNGATEPLESLPERPADAPGAMPEKIAPSEARAATRSQ
jgi:hypothetical protein